MILVYQCIKKCYAMNVERAMEMLIKSSVDEKKTV